MKLYPAYVLTDADGRPEFEIEGTIEQAVEVGLSKYGKHTRIYFDGDLDQMGHEPEHGRMPNATLAGPPTVEAALNAIRKTASSPFHDLPLTNDEMWRRFPDTKAGLDAAHALLAPYYPQSGDIMKGGYKLRSGEIAKDREVGDSYGTAANMSKAFLQKNTKTEKAIEGVTGVIPPSLSKGFAFLPYTLGTSKAKYPLAKGLPMVDTKMNGVCVGSSAACRTSCLLNSGQNQLTANNNAAKASRLASLLFEPYAFARMWVDSTRKFIASCEKAGLVPYIRPNVLSDLPWEAIWPGYWELFSNLRVYDYTKLVGRAPPFGKHADAIAKYDLTFSFSGDNLDYLEQELDRGTRVAVVFLRGLKSGSEKLGNLKPAESLDDIRFLGRPVIDGDLHDLRPVDPPGTVVGLRFKSLGGKKDGQGNAVSRGKQLRDAESFVVGAKGSKFDARDALREPGFPRHSTKFLVEAYRDDQGQIIAAVTPRQTNASE